MQTRHGPALLMDLCRLSLLRQGLLVGQQSCGRCSLHHGVQRCAAHHERFEPDARLAQDGGQRGQRVLQHVRGADVYLGYLYQAAFSPCKSRFRQQHNNLLHMTASPACRMWQQQQAC